MKIIDALVSPKVIYLDLNKLNQRHLDVLFSILGFVLCSYIVFYLHLDQAHVHRSLVSEHVVDINNKALSANTLDNIVPLLGLLIGVLESLIILLKILFVSLMLFFWVKFTQREGIAIPYKVTFNATIFAFVPCILIALGRVGIYFAYSNCEIPLGTSEYTSIGQLFFNGSYEPYHLYQFINIFDIWSIALISQFLFQQKIYSLSKSLLIASSFFLTLYFVFWLIV